MGGGARLQAELTDSVTARCRMSILLVSRAIPMACLYSLSVKQRWNIRFTTSSRRGSMGPTPCSAPPSNRLADSSAYLSMHFATEGKGEGEGRGRGGEGRGGEGRGGGGGEEHSKSLTHCYNEFK